MKYHPDYWSPSNILSHSKFAKAWIQANHLSNVIIYRQGISLSLLLQCLLKLIFLEMTTSEENLFGGQIMRNYLLPMAAPPKVSKVKWYNTKPPYEGRRRKTRRNGWVADVSLQCIVVRQCGSHCGSMRGNSTKWLSGGRVVWSDNVWIFGDRTHIHRLCITWEKFLTIGQMLSLNRFRWMELTETLLTWIIHSVILSGS